MYNRALSLFVFVLVSSLLFNPRAATFTVTNTADSGAGSLRQAILDANANAGPDVIDFNIAPAGEKTITLANASGGLADISDPVTIDGTTQPGFSGKAAIEVSGASVLTAVDGLRITTSNCVVRGLVIDRFRSDGIEINGGGNNVIEGCIIGLNLAGATVSANSFNGVLISDSSSNRIGGATAAARNIISGNVQQGVRIDGVTSMGNVVSGNYIGVDITAAIDRGNNQHGVYVNGPVATTIGGATIDERNIISGNDQNGILIEGAGSERTGVYGNYIGTDAQGLVDLGNTADGVRINLVGNHRIGGAGKGNLISGNNSDGIEITGATATNNYVEANLIGVNSTGAAGLANSTHGIQISANASWNYIGGAVPGQGNTIAFNNQDAIYILAGTNNTIRANSTFSNGGQGIDLDPNGATANDSNDADVGANQRQNFPILTSAVVSATETLVTGTLNSTPGGLFWIDVYSVSNPDVSGGEGQQYLGAFMLNTDVAENGFFSVPLIVAANGRYVCATATDEWGNTSEFSPNINVATTAPGAKFTVTTTADSGAGSLRQAILDANASLGVSTIAFNIPGDGPHTITNLTALPAITNTVVIDGYSQPGAIANTDAAAFNGVVKIVLTRGTTAPSFDGLSLQWPGSVVRGLNIIGMGGDGIEIGTVAPGCIVEGCVIGLDSTSVARANSGAGININNSYGNRIGGTTPAARNVISGNNNAGVVLEGAGANANIIVGNNMGVTLNGLAKVANLQDGVRINGGSNNTIGGTIAGARNVLSGNGQDGVEISQTTSTGNNVEGNFIGADVTGGAALGNSGYGVAVFSARNAMIGGSAAGAANVIAFNTQDGVGINGGTNITVRGNSIHSNSGLGIDLDVNNVTANDVGDGDAGANQRQNFPTITSALAHASSTDVSGALNSGTNLTYTIDFYANSVADPLGNGEGQQYLGSTSVTTDSNGSATFSVSLPVAATGKFICATATDSFGNTSEFGPCFGASSDVPGQTFTVTTTADSEAGSLRQAILEANALFDSGDMIAFNIPGAGPHTISLASALPGITDAVTIDGYTQPGATANTSAADFNGALKIVLNGTAVATVSDGLSVQWPGVTIRGLNIISFRNDGIEIGALGSNCVVEGCLIGSGLDGSDQGNNQNGIFIIGAANVRIGAATAAARNVISGNHRHGVEITGATSANNRVVGNSIGLGLDGSTRLGNSDGININNGAHDNTIGGATDGERNVISGNASDGVEINGATTLNNVVIGNYIGLDASGTVSAFNAGSGVFVLNSAHDNRVGGAVAGERNRIAFNNNDGVTLSGSTNNAVRANAIFNNVDIGIDLSNNNVTANDVGDADVGPNNLQNFPILTAATANAANTRIGGTLNSRADTTYQVDFFSNLQFVNTGVYEGEKYLGGAAVTTDASGNASFDVVVSGVVNGRFITATATDPNGNTSEFSPFVRAESTIAPPTLVVTTTDDSGGGSLRQALLDAGNYVVGEPVNINFNIPGVGPHFIYPLTQLPTPAESIFLNGYSQPGASANTLAQGNDAILKINLSGSNSFTAGLRLTNSGNIIRGLAVIQFGQGGIEINGNSNRVEGCFIGLDSAGVARGNNAAGIHIIPLNPFGNATGGTNNIIGGSAPAARNVISANFGYQIHIENGGSSNVVQGNYIGTNPAGTEGFATPTSAGIQIMASRNVQIGGAAPGEGNLISGNNNSTAINIIENGFSGARIIGNIIGPDVTGASGLATRNYNGLVLSGASGVTIGGANAGEPNVIAFNAGHGVQISSGTENSVRGNTIFSNTGVGINLGFDAVTENDPDDADSGANNLQNFPVLISAHGTATDTTVAGTLNARPNREYRIDLFANILPDETGYGEGQQYLGSVTVTTGADGNANFNVTLPAVIVGRFITATATDPDGNISEFSRAFEATTTFPAETFVVTNTNDSGAGSLRQAILENNRSRAGANNIISFNIPGAGPHTITPSTPLDAPLHAVTIDGFTQPGSAVNTLMLGDNSVRNIRLDGANTVQTGLTIRARNSIVRGLSITRFESGVMTEGSGVQIAGCWIGIAPDGTTAANQSYGVYISSGDALIGGSNAGDRNVISGNNSYGVFMLSTTAGSRVAGNYIGTSPTGLAAAPNGNAGIFLSGENHTIGGPTVGERNVISGNPLGIYVSFSTNATIQGNFIGPDANGTGRFTGGTGQGINFTRNSPGNVVRGNVISGNGYLGIQLYDTGCVSNRIVGNFIGADASGTGALPNGSTGIAIAVANNQIGGSDEADGNIIAFNGEYGVLVIPGTTGVGIRKNRMFRNAFIGIDLTGDSVTANDATDADSGANQLQNYPVITGATVGVSDVQISGYLQSAPNQAFDVDFFANVAADSSGYGEGEQLLGSAVVNTGVDGRGDFNVTFSKVAIGRFITATATDAQSNSSEFSATFRAASTRPPQTLVVTTDADSGPGSLRQALIDAGTIMSSSANKIHFNIPGGGARVIQILSQLPAPAESVEIDGFTQPNSAANTEPDRDAAVRVVELRGAPTLLSFEDGLRFTTAGNIVRGLIVSQFPGNGIVLSNADNSIIEGSLVVSNGASGVVINSSVGDVIGGAEPQKRNTISGNASSGIFVITPLVPGRVADNRILGNFIGLDTNGGNSHRAQNQGVYISTGFRTQVGGPAAGEGNWIAYNTRGVAVQNSSENRIRGNRIFANNSLGIDLGFNGITQNDVGDADNGANALQNFPVLQTANITTSGTRFVGALNSIANSNFTIDFYSSDSCDNNGFGEGARYLGQTSVSTDGSGNASFDFVLPLRIPRGVVTATATDAAGNTSEFSGCTTVGTEIPPQLYLVTNTNDSGAGSLRQAILEANDAFTTGRNTIGFNIPGAGVRTISLATPLPNISGLIAVDGFTQPGAQVNTSAADINATLLIRLEGANAGAGADGLRVTGAGSLVRGLIITRFSGAGIHVINANNVIIDENIIGGTDASPASASALENKKAGVAADVFLSGNGGGILIQGGAGVQLGTPNSSSFLTVVQNNTFGVRAEGGSGLTLQNGILAANGQPDNPGAIGGADFFNTVNTTVRNNTFGNNFPVNLGLREGASGSSFGARVENNVFRGNTAVPSSGILVDGAAYNVIGNNTLDGLPGVGIHIINNSTSGNSDVLSNTIINGGDAAILVRDGNFNFIGGVSPGQENTIFNNPFGVIILGGTGNCAANNIVGINNFPLQIPVPPSAPNNQPPSIRDAGNEKILTARGTTDPNDAVFVEAFRLDTIENTLVMRPVGAVTVNSDPNGVYTTEIVIPSSPSNLPLFGSIAVSQFGDASPMTLNQAPAGESGNLAVLLEGPTSVSVGEQAVFKATFNYTAPESSAYGAFNFEIPIPSGFEVVTIQSTGDGMYKPSFRQENGKIIVQSAILKNTQQTLTVTMKGVLALPFEFTIDATVQGYNNNPLDDFAQIKGSVIQPINGIELFSTIIDQRDILNSPAEQALTQFLYSNMGRTPATGVAVTINPGPDGIVIPPTAPVDGVMLNFDPAQNKFTGFPPITLGQPSRLPFKLWFRGEGTKTVTVQATHDGIDENPNNNTTTFNIVVNPVTGNVFDFSDLPNSFGTLDSAIGAKHFISGPFLGAGVTPEVDGLPSPDANADSGDDGFMPVGPWIAGQIGQADVTVNQRSFFNGYIDFNGDGVFDPATEFISPLILGNPNPLSGLGSFELQPGVNRIRIPIPNRDFGPKVFGRFRVSLEENLAPLAAAATGEVEDYEVKIAGQGVTPILRFSTDVAGSLVLDFTGFLDSAPAVTGPWTRRATQSPFTVDPRVGQMFFRASSE
ncbi:MAG TPA: right-handed parallel beta-helix repeat-containing protein [Verrucomicrobiae bacterium]|nr:right-handed parallel beta-helix repeat-containing protein [Verrucomicrobiae bacterium]